MHGFQLSATSSHMRSHTSDTLIYTSTSQYRLAAFESHDVRLSLLLSYKKYNGRVLYILSMFSFILFTTSISLSFYFSVFI